MRALYPPSSGIKWTLEDKYKKIFRSLFKRSHSENDGIEALIRDLYDRLILFIYYCMYVCMYAVFIYKHIHTNMYLDLTRGVVPTCMYVLIRYSYSVYIVVEVLLYFDVCMYVCVNDMAVCWRLFRLLIELRSTWSAMRWCFWSARDT